MSDKSSSVPVTQQTLQLVINMSVVVSDEDVEVKVKGGVNAAESKENLKNSSKTGRRKEAKSSFNWKTRCLRLIVLLCIRSDQWGSSAFYEPTPKILSPPGEFPYDTAEFSE